MQCGSVLHGVCQRVRVLTVVKAFGLQDQGSVCVSVVPREAVGALFCSCVCSPQLPCDRESVTRLPVLPVHLGGLIAWQKAQQVVQLPLLDV